MRIFGQVGHQHNVATAQRQRPATLVWGGSSFKVKAQGACSLRCSNRFNAQTDPPPSFKLQAINGGPIIPPHYLSLFPNALNYIIFSRVRPNILYNLVDGEISLEPLEFGSCDAAWRFGDRG